MPHAAVIRLATPDDGEALAAVYRPAVEGFTSFESEPPTGAAMAERVADTLHRLPWLVCDIDGVVTGRNPSLT